MNYKPEVFYDKERDYTYEELSAICENGTIIAARATMYDRQKNLHVTFGKYDAIIPFFDCADGLAEFTTKEIAVVSRVGHNVCFVIEQIQKNESGLSFKLSRTKAQQLCKVNYINKLTVGDNIDCTVTHIENFGAFCDIGCGISALLPIDCMSVSRINSARDRVYVGQRLKCTIKNIDDRARIVLSLKELLGTWAQNAALFNAGETVTGIVRSIEHYGIFVELTPNLAGLAESFEGLQPGDYVSVYIKSILSDKMKVKLVIIQKADNVLPSYALKYFCDTKHIDAFVYADGRTPKTN